MTDHSLTIAVWVGLALVAVAMEVLGRTRLGRLSSANTVFGLAIRPPAGRLLVGLGWIWLGWHVFAR